MSIYFFTNDDYGHFPECKCEECMRIREKELLEIKKKADKFYKPQPKSR